VPIGIALVVLGLLVLPETQRHRGRFDLVGALLSTLGMSALVYGFVRAASAGWSNLFTVGSFIAGVVLLAAFARTELRAEKPITPLSLLFDRSCTGAVVARGLLFAGLFGLFFFLTQFLQDVLHYSPLQTGFAFLPLPLTVFAMSQLTSRVLVHKVDGKALMVAGITLAGAGFLLLSRLTPASPYLTVLEALLLVAIGNGLSVVPLTSAAIDRVAPADAGAASGLVNVTQQLGGTLGVAILVTVFGAASTGATRLVSADPASQAAHLFTVGATHAFLAASLFLLSALAVVAVAVRAPKPRSAP
jgi:predicted MFS family arabinose efflux permease